MRININNNIRVRLTPYGDEILHNYYKKESEWIDMDLMSLIPEKDSEGYSEFQLWGFMLIFGSKMYMSGKQIIEQNIIII